MMSDDAMTSCSEVITWWPEAAANFSARAMSMSKHPPRVIGTPLIFNIFEWKVAMWPVPRNPTTGSVEVVLTCMTLLLHTYDRDD